MRPIADIKDYWARIRERAGLQDVRIHDLRRTCGTKMAEAGVPLHTISTVLNHSDSEVTKVYARIADNVQREALEAVGDNLEDVLGKIGIPTIAVVA
jgi:integrase